MCCSLYVQNRNKVHFNNSGTIKLSYCTFFGLNIFFTGRFMSNNHAVTVMF